MASPSAERKDGHDVVLLHGWGMNSAVWSEVRMRLDPRYRIHALDLPGHGRSDARVYADLEAWADHLARAAPARCVVCGWSLGGIIALAWALAAPRQVSRLALIATTPCFVRREGWPHGLTGVAVTAFRDALAHDREAALHRFLALQARGDERQTQVARTLRRIVLASARRPDAEMLRQGLTLLLETDLRSRLIGVQQPAIVVHGARDGVAPLAAAQYLAGALPHARLSVVAGAGHAPLLSDAEAVSALLAEFLDER